jgi:hypothetical protein
VHPAAVVAKSCCWSLAPARVNKQSAFNYMIRLQSVTGSLPEPARFLPLLATAATWTDLEQHFASAAALEAYLDSSDRSRLQQLVTGTRLFELLCNACSCVLRLLATAPSSPTAAPAAAAATANDRALMVVAALFSSADKLLGHELLSQSASGDSCKDRMLASVDASGELPAAAQLIIMCVATQDAEQGEV